MTQKLVKKKILAHDHGKYVATQEFNKLAAGNFATRLKQANSATKNDIADFVEAKYVLVENGLNKLPKKLN